MEAKVNSKEVTSFIIGGTDEFQKNEKVHLRVTQRGKRKNITSIEGLKPFLLENNTTLEKFLAHIRKKLGCNGNIDTKKVPGKKRRVERMKASKNPGKKIKL